MENQYQEKNLQYDKASFSSFNHSQWTNSEHFANSWLTKNQLIGEGGIPGFINPYSHNVCQFFNVEDDKKIAHAAVEFKGGANQDMTKSALGHGYMVQAETNSYITIDTNGRESFAEGCRNGGGFILIDKANNLQDNFYEGNIFITDSVLNSVSLGYAGTVGDDVESRHDKTSPAIGCITAENFDFTVENVRSNFPKANIIICANVPQPNTNNPNSISVSQAQEAAAKYNCSVVSPKLNKDELAAGLSSFNDLRLSRGEYNVMDGLAAVSESVKPAMVAVAVTVPEDRSLTGVDAMEAYDIELGHYINLNKENLQSNIKGLETQKDKLEGVVKDLKENEPSKLKSLINRKEYGHWQEKLNQNQETINTVQKDLYDLKKHMEVSFERELTKEFRENNPELTQARDNAVASIQQADFKKNQAQQQEKQQNKGRSL